MSGYSDREAAEIIRKAAEKQHQGEPGEGLSLEDLERIAGELGIDPKHVRAAAQEAPVQRSLESLRFERTLPLELDDVTWARLVDRMRAKFGGIGTLSQVGSTREWAGLEVALTVTGRNLVLRVDRSSSVWGMFIPGGVLALVLTIGLAQVGNRMAGPLGALALASVFAGASFLGLNWAVKAWAAKNTRVLETFADSLPLGLGDGLAIPETAATSVSIEDEPVSQRDQ